MFSAQVHGIAAVLLCLAALAPAQQPSVMSDFLATIGGDTSVRTVTSDKNQSSAYALPLSRDAADLVGYRFFKENMAVRRPVALSRAKAAFAAECQAKDGRLLAGDDPVTLAFLRRRVTSLLPPSRPFHVWEGHVMVCVGPSGHALGGLAAISESKGYEPAEHTGGSQLVGLLMPSHARTAVYAYHPRAVGGTVSPEQPRRQLAPSTQEIAARDAERQRALAKRDDEFRRAIEVGTETNCGAVIQVRGPMVEVAVPPMRVTPGGQSTFWARRTALYPPGPTICTFGH